MTEGTFNQGVAKGAHLLNLLTAHEVEQSIFTTYSDLGNYGYIESPQYGRFAFEPLRACLQGLGVDDRVSDNGGRNVRVYHEHSQDALVDQIAYPFSSAYFLQVVNHEDGVLIAYSNSTAQYMLDDTSGVSSGVSWPPLYHWSDVAFLQFLGAFTTTPALPMKLNYVIQHAIQNLTTLAMLEHVLFGHDVGPQHAWPETLPAWPGIHVGMDTDEGKAILSTPNGCGAAWLLAQHKEQFGPKTVDKVTIFAASKGDDYRGPSLVFWLKDLYQVEGKKENVEALPTDLTDSEASRVPINSPTRRTCSQYDTSESDPDVDTPPDSDYNEHN